MPAQAARRGYKRAKIYGNVLYETILDFQHDPRSVLSEKAIQSGSSFYSFLYLP
jgi:hypothetical protein